MDIFTIKILLIDVVVSVVLIVMLRFLLAAIIGVHAKDELDKSDNVAFGVALSGSVLGMLLMVSGVMSGDPLSSMMQEMSSMCLYGILGSGLLLFGVFIQDKLVMRSVSLLDAIKKENVAAGVLVAANMIAIGLIAKGTLTWTDSEGVDGLLNVIIIFVISQILLALVAFLRMSVYRIRNQKLTSDNSSISGNWQGAIEAGNTAVAIRYAGQVIATAIAITTTSLLVEDPGGSAFSIVIPWFAIGFAFTLLIWLFYRLLIKLVLFKINIVEEVDHQSNIGVASIEAALFLGIALVIFSYMT